MAGSLILSGNQFHIHRKSPPTVTAETIARHHEKTSVGRAKVLSGGDTGYRLAEVEVVTSSSNKTTTKITARIRRSLTVNYH